MQSFSERDSCLEFINSLLSSFPARNEAGDWVPAWVGPDHLLHLILCIWPYKWLEEGSNKKYGLSPLYLQYGIAGLALSALCVSLWCRNAAVLWLEYSCPQFAVGMGILMLLSLTRRDVCYVISQLDLGKKKTKVGKHWLSRLLAFMLAGPVLVLTKPRSRDR